MRAYDRALTLWPDYADAWHGKSVALANLGRDEEALARPPSRLGTACP